jgi:3-isopropylmalate/(R)-2-methylmalate dehydratase small subunit
MRAQLRGRAFLFGADVTTDDILPGRYLDRSNDEAGAFAMAGLDPDFTRKVSPGDFIVAGQNFGAGSGRENAPAAILGAGIAAVIAPSFARLFYRNAINLGLPAVMVDSVSGIREGDWLELDLEARRLSLPAPRQYRVVLNLTGTSREILEAGGIVAYSRARQGKLPR